MGKCKDEMIKLINGDIDEVYILSEFEGIDNISMAIQLWKYNKEKDIISYCTMTKTNLDKPYFIKIKNGVSFVEKKYIGENPTDDAKVKLINKNMAFELLK